jgi:phosphotransferase system HPr-like phosphotransfer protein
MCAVTVQESASAHATLDNLMKTINAKANDVRRLLTLQGTQNQDLRVTISSTFADEVRDNLAADLAIRETRYTVLTQKMGNTMRMFSAAQDEIRRRQKDSLVRANRIVHQDALDTEIVHASSAIQVFAPHLEQVFGKK